MRVLLIEDDCVLGDGLRKGLSQEGHTVDWLTDGEQGAAALLADDFDAVILDLALPGRSGMDILADWRAAGHAIPVLILTAYDAVDDRVRGLDGGADDYLTKPVDLAELSARLRALYRRGAGHADNVRRYGDLALDLATRSATLGGTPLHLSRHELTLLEALLERPGQVVSREHMEAQLYGWGDGPESNSLEVHIHNLRRQLGPDRVLTARGLGYRLAEPDP